jgi:hypothetical protein
LEILLNFLTKADPTNPEEPAIKTFTESD